MLFEKKNDEEWLANLVEKKEIDSEQHSFLKELLEKYTKKFGTDESESSESSDSASDMPALVSPSKGPLRPLVAQNPSLRGGNQDDSESSSSDDLLI